MKAVVSTSVDEGTSVITRPSNLPVIIAVISSVARCIFIGLVVTVVLVLVVRYRKRKSVDFQRLDNEMQTSFVAIQ